MARRCAWTSRPNDHAMPRLTFRTKLLLAMMLVVTAVCVATLLVTQRHVQANYERMFREQYQRQVGYFTSLQDARLASVKEQCLELAQSVRLLAALKEAEGDAVLLYQTARQELRSVLDQFDEAPAAARRTRGPVASFYRFVDAQGKPISPPAALAGRRFSPALRQWIEKRFGFARDALKAPEVQQVAYLPLIAQTNEFDAARSVQLRARAKSARENDEGTRLALQEIIITKIIDPADNHTLGGLVLAFPLPDLVPQPRRTAHGNDALTNQVQLIQAGILIEEQLFASPTVIPDSLGMAIAELISARSRDHRERRGELACEVERTPYRVFFELLNEGSAFPAAYQVCLYSMAEARREQADLRLKIVGLGGGALGVALVLSLVISHGLSAPIRQLVVGTREVQRGNFAVRVPVRSGDEIGQLASSFNEMAEGLAQKERYRTVLNMFADEKVAQRMIAGQLTLGGELREISVVFCDIRGFTALTQNMPPAEVIEMLNEHMTALMRVVKEHNGLLDKFVGDLLMVIFGAPVSQGDDTLNAARCALRLVAVRQELNQTSKHKIQIGIGVATGTVVAGCMGSADRLNYTVLGDRVNLGSRLCDQARAGEVLIDENTRQKLGGAIIVEATGDIQLKGFSAPVQAFRLRAVREEEVVS